MSIARRHPAIQGTFVGTVLGDNQELHFLSNPSGYGS
jgi:hypothetical protein